MHDLPLDLLHRTLIALAGMFKVHLLDIPDCPVFLAAAMPISDEVTGAKPRLPAGRGLTARQAMTSAAAEALELKSSLARNCKPARFGARLRGGRDFIPAVDLTSGDRIDVPAQDVFLDYAVQFGEPLANDADSTGCAAGASLADANTAGLLECVERDAVASWWYGRKSRPHLAIEILDDVAPRLAWWLAARGRPVRLIDVTTDIGIPVVVAVSSDRDGTAVAIGSAANLDLRAAAVSAVTEMVQTEVAIQMGDRASNEELDGWLTAASVNSMPQFAAAGGAAGQRRNDGSNVLDRVTAAGFRACAVDLTAPGDPLHVVRVLVPGFSALRRRIVAERILAHPGGVGCADEFEMLELY